MFTCDRCGREISEDEAASQPARDDSSGTLCESCAGERSGMPEKGKQSIRLINLLLLMLVSLVIATVWFLLFFLTGYPWDFLSVLAGWGIGRLILMWAPGEKRELMGVLAILLTLLIIVVREYLILSLVVSYTSALNPSEARFTLLPLTSFQLVLREALSLNPFSILMWMLSVGIAFITAIGIRSNKTEEK